MNHGHRYRKSRKDYPKGVIGIYNNNGRSLDRYTVVYEPETISGTNWFIVCHMNGNPYHPQMGICLHDQITFRLTSDAWQPRNTKGAGKTINFADLPEDCQKVVRQDLETWT